MHPPVRMIGRKEKTANKHNSEWPGVNCAFHFSHHFSRANTTQKWIAFCRPCIIDHRCDHRSPHSCPKHDFAEHSFNVILFVYWFIFNTLNIPSQNLIDTLARLYAPAKSNESSLQRSKCSMCKATNHKNIKIIWKFQLYAWFSVDNRMDNRLTFSLCAPFRFEPALKTKVQSKWKHDVIENQCHFIFSIDSIGQLINQT